ncbi:MAG TPA: phosphoribosyltransferase family protein [Solirubrobacterales bacterium]
MKALHAVAAGLVPPLCAACGRSCSHESIICSRCRRRLADVATLATRLPGIDFAWFSALYGGVARDLVIALKVRRLLPVAELIAEHIDWLAPGSALSGSIVPVPTARLRTAKRGFDPAGEIAFALSERTGLPLRECLVREGGGRQVGKRRAQRLGDPPRILVRGEVPRSALLIDDVCTTGATLSACARALRNGGAARVEAIAFARRL